MLSFGALAQETALDTIGTVKKFQKEAKTAVQAQDFETAMIRLNKANKLVSTSTDLLLRVDVLLSIAELNYYLQNYSKAATETNNAIILLNKINDQEKLAKAYSLYGFILTRTGDFANSEKFLKEADKIITQLGDEKKQAEVVLGFGILELKKKNYNKNI